MCACVTVYVEEERQCLRVCVFVHLGWLQLPCPFARVWALDFFFLFRLDITGKANRRRDAALLNEGGTQM